MRQLKADLHIHSCLSPCGDLEMSPSAIARQAAALNLDFAAVTDHNSAANCRTFDICCRQFNIIPIFGIEVTSIEEAHVLCLFEFYEQAEELGGFIYENLPDIPNNPEKFGDQVIVDKDENILGEVEKYLLSAARISLDELYMKVSRLSGMFIPAHIDKPIFSIPSQLGFLPDMNYDALETTVLPCPVATGNIPLIRNSDAHYLEDIGKRFSLYQTEAATFSGIKEAMHKNKISIT